jgi:multidrug efflux system outer membrane protein
LKRYHALPLAALILSGCVPLERQAPASAAVTPPAAWRNGPTGTAAVDPAWWSGFGDPTLPQLVQAALAHNTDVLAAAGRVQAAEASIRIARSALLPTLDAGVSGQRSRSLGSAGAAASTAVQPELQMSWQADFFGRLGSLSEAARLQYVATQADRDAAALSVAAAVAQAYIALIALDAQLHVSQETVQSRKEALRLATDQAQVGYISQYELTQAQSEYESVEQAIPRLQQAIVAQENALRRLSGELPGAVARGGTLRTLQVPPVPLTLPSDLLRHRPDVRSAELTVAAADASLAANRQALLPQVALSANLGKLYTDALNYNPVTVWSLGGSILAPIFDGGRLRAQVDVATAQRDQAAFAYRGTVLAAFEEVETALSGTQRLAEQFDRTLKRRAILLRSVALATDRYRGGYATYLEQLDAQRNLYSTELDAISVRQEQLDNTVSLYRALGGGWNGTTEQLPR